MNRASAQLAQLIVDTFPHASALLGAFIAGCVVSLFVQRWLSR